ncbi:cell division membrane protein FtsY (plasmid) [Legionella adelaidensis]|uniref:Signal recognition particle receptor FtsY n=1 Tax=Legionella adelaidensis TaxID=45056 RepID=A0A0W0R0C0_9GAMM|nr:signal recognition particle-docking protein FtsY [Legionella adelaidensis]KTC64504.1 cell division membrane protein FtsY [Legionella adelaidensis]VEH85872.1 cell division membrane protein FtsY [Legionella adelaidensis]
MINWFKRNKDSEESSERVANESAAVEDTPEQQEKKPGFLSRFKQGLTKTRHQLGEGVGRLLLGKKEIDAAILEELETLLLSADVGIETTNKIIQELKAGLARHQLSDGETVFAALKNHLLQILSVQGKPLELSTEDKSPFVILMVGINGAGKTTTIGKLAKQYQKQGKKVMLAAGDTFRAAAVEQLQEWGSRNQIPVISQHSGADSASVIYDAFQSAKAKGIDVLIADTAGRLHTQQNLMEELKKVKRVIQKIDAKAPHEVMLVLDASIGQNALNQARQFNEAVDVTGITMTKLDGTAKGGILFAIASELEIPFRYIGVGEGIDDLRLFDPTQFVNVIFDDNI